jgi:hypothetical protein
MGLSIARATARVLQGGTVAQLSYGPALAMLVPFKSVLCKKNPHHIKLAIHSRVCLVVL